MTRKELLIILDSIGYDLFNEVQPENMMKIGELHKAHSHGCWTLPSITTFFAGILPTCTIENCYHNKIFEAHPYFVEEITRNKYVYISTSNGWMWKQMLSINRVGYYPKTYDYSQCTPEIVQDILNRNKNITYFHMMLLMETHQPYAIQKNQTFNTWDNMKILKQRQITALKHLDKTLKPILTPEYNIIITADHGENFEKGNYGHKTKQYRPKLTEVPLISNWKPEQ